MDMVAVKLAPTLGDFEAGDTTINPATPIWHSTFGDDQWVFTLPNDPLYKGHSSAQIDWTAVGSRSPRTHHMVKYEFCLTEQMVLETKIAAYIYAIYPNFFRGSKTSKTSLSGETVRARVLDLAKIGSHFIRSCAREGLVIKSFADVTFGMLKSHASTVGSRPDHLKRAMRLITTEVVQRNLPSKLKITLGDVDSKSINWGIQFEYKGIQTLSDAQFLFLLNHCKRAIAEFKIAMEIEVHDKDIVEYARQIRIDKFRCIQGPLEEWLWGNLSEGSSRARRFRGKYGYCAKVLTDLYREAHKASMLVTILLTGMRESEFSHLRVGSLKHIDGFNFLVSKVVKRKHEGAPLRDRWLAIPLVEDAYDVLSYACSKTRNAYLFAPPIRLKRKGGLGYNTLNTTFNRWIKSIDQHNLFDGHTFSVHQGRESLAYQLAKHKVGLPFISKQLKHFYSRFNRMPNDVTAEYGEYRRNLQLSIESRLAHAREDVLMDVFGEQKSFAGGGGNIHKKRIDSWFKGAGLFGEDRAKYIKNLARSNVALMPTSIGICTHNFIVTTSNEVPPPCYGDFSCDPECPNHVISEGCASALKERQQYAITKAKDDDKRIAVVWNGLANQLSKHVNKLRGVRQDD